MSVFEGLVFGGCDQLPGEEAMQEAGCFVKGRRGKPAGAGRRAWRKKRPDICPADRNRPRGFPPFRRDWILNLLRLMEKQFSCFLLFLTQFLTERFFRHEFLQVVTDGERGCHLPARETAKGSAGDDVLFGRQIGQLRL